MVSPMVGPSVDRGWEPLSDRLATVFIIDGFQVFLFICSRKGNKWNLKCCPLLAIGLSIHNDIITVPVLVSARSPLQPNIRSWTRVLVAVNKPDVIIFSSIVRVARAIHGQFKVCPLPLARTGTVMRILISLFVSARSLAGRILAQRALIEHWPSNRTECNKLYYFNSIKCS